MQHHFSYSNFFIHYNSTISNTTLECGPDRWCSKNFQQESRSRNTKQRENWLNFLNNLEHNVWIDSKNFFTWQQWITYDKWLNYRKKYSSLFIEFLAGILKLLPLHERVFFSLLVLQQNSIELSKPNIKEIELIFPIKILQVSLNWVSIACWEKRWQSK